MDVVEIFTEVSLPPALLGNSIGENIRKILLKDKLHSCSKQDGYIIDILEILSYEKNRLSRTGSSVIFDVVFSAEVFLPRYGSEIEAVVKIIFFKKGLRLNSYNLNIFVPATNLKDWEFKNDSIVRGSESIRSGDTVIVVITNTRYEKKRYDCIGILKES